MKKYLFVMLAATLLTACGGDDNDLDVVKDPDTGLSSANGFIDYSSLIGLKKQEMIELLGEPDKNSYGGIVKSDYRYSGVSTRERLNDMYTYELYINMSRGRIGGVRQIVLQSTDRSWESVIAYFNKKYHHIDDSEKYSYFTDNSTPETSTIMIDVSEESEDYDYKKLEIHYDGLLGEYSFYDEETEVLTIKYENEYVALKEYDSHSNIYREQAKKVVFDPSFAKARPVETSYWFEDFHYLTEIVGWEYVNTSEVEDMTKMFYRCSSLSSLDLSCFDTGNVENMNEMFSGCSSLPSLDLSSFDTGNVENINEMFYGCKNLKTIYVSKRWTTDKVKMRDSSNSQSTYKKTFYDCELLVGGMGTQYDSRKTEAKYARIDGGPEAPGYLTTK